MSETGQVSGSRRRNAAADRLMVDPVACDGIGMCSHLASRLIGVDSWGFPVMPAGAVPKGDLRAARAAVAACPRRALFLVPDET